MTDWKNRCLHIYRFVHFATFSKRVVNELISILDKDCFFLQLQTLKGSKRLQRLWHFQNIVTDSQTEMQSKCTKAFFYLSKYGSCLSIDWFLRPNLTIIFQKMSISRQAAVALLFCIFWFFQWYFSSRLLSFSDETTGSCWHFQGSYHQFLRPCSDWC